MSAWMIQTPHLWIIVTVHKFLIWTIPPWQPGPSKMSCGGSHCQDLSGGTWRNQINCRLTHGDPLTPLHEGRTPDGIFRAWTNRPLNRTSIRLTGWLAWNQSAQHYESHIWLLNTHRFWFIFPTKSYQLATYYQHTALNGCSTHQLRLAPGRPPSLYMATLLRPFWVKFHDVKFLVWKTVFSTSNAGPNDELVYQPLSFTMLDLYLPELIVACQNSLSKPTYPTMAYQIISFPGKFCIHPQPQLICS